MTKQSNSQHKNRRSTYLSAGLVLGTGAGLAVGGLAAAGIGAAVGLIIGAGLESRRQKSETSK